MVCSCTAMARSDVADTSAGMATNYFSLPAIAERYAYARPHLDPRFNEVLLRHTGRLGRVADFGCGTGLSSRALAEVADSVVGLDSSVAMLEDADAHPRVRYCAGVAETTPFAGGSFELVAPFFRAREEVFPFGGSAWLLRRAKAPA
jgi:SAM-dependent methyltransferase